MQKLFIVHIPSFYYDVIFSIGQTDKELKRGLKKICHPDDLTEISKNLNLKEGIGGLCSELDNRASVIRMPKYPKGKERVFILACLQHEIFHASCNVMRSIDTKLTKSTEEVYAYIITYLTEECYKQLDYGVSSVKS